jgi:ketosteroid isomerase-like protein
MRSRQRMVAGLVLLFMGAGAALGQTSGKETDAILAADAAWLRVYQAKDLAKSVAFCDEQASMLAPNAPIATGKDAIAKVIADDFAHDTIIWHANKVGVARSGELGYTSGTTENSIKDASGQTKSDKGKYLTVWKKQADGSWKVLYDMFNSDLRPAREPLNK